MKTTAVRTADGRPVAERVVHANSFGERFLGLLNKKSLAADEGLLLSPGASIHTFGMHFAIDVVFLSGQLKVLKLCPCITPWSFCLAPACTKHVLELAAGRIASAGLTVNSHLCIELPAEAHNATRDTINQVPAEPTLERSSIQFSLRLPVRTDEHPRPPSTTGKPYAQAASTTKSTASARY